ncbi:MAG: threonine dehydratase [Acidimicrobiia bacterium]|jgi:threonine dehydratase|nr:threonine dehydratase [Acidimicrobiia bacterium]
MSIPVTWSDVEAAARRLAGVVDRTPSAPSRTLSGITGAEVVVKFENLQFTGSFKDRGAANRLMLLSPEERARGVVAVSAGNHAQGVAYHAARLGVSATILMPVTAPLAKVANTARLGARIVQHGATLAEAMERLPELQEEGRILIHPYDDPAVIAGQGTVGLELLTDHPDLDVVVVPVGGGGLISGITVAAHHLAPSCQVVGVQAAGYAYMAAALNAAGMPPLPSGHSIADGIAVKSPGVIARKILSNHGIEVLTVPEARLEEAIGLLLEVEKTVSEGAGAASLAALLDKPDRFAGRKVGIVLSGGNIDPRVLSSVILRSLVRQGRLTRMRVETDDLPGNLARIAATIGRLGGNLIEVTHQRLLSAVPVRRVDIDLLVETLDAEHLARICIALEGQGDAVDLIEP